MAHFTVNFLSYTLNRAVNINVILPTMCGPEVAVKPHTHRVETTYPVLYLLHGGINDYSTWERYTSIERYAEERQIAVVTFSSENKCYRDIDAGGKEDFLFGRDHLYTFGAEELPDFVTSIFPISKDPQHTYIAGLSMGGMGTLNFALRHPERYRAIGVLSASAGMGTTIGGLSYDENYDNVLLLRKRAEEGVPLPAIYTAIGGEDFGLENFKNYLKLMDDLNISYTAEIVPGYDHEWAFWDMEIVKFLDWLPRTDRYHQENPKRRI